MGRLRSAWHARLEQVSLGSLCSHGRQEARPDAQRAEAQSAPSGMNGPSPDEEEAHDVAPPRRAPTGMRCERAAMGGLSNPMLVGGGALRLRRGDAGASPSGRNPTPHRQPQPQPAVARRCRWPARPAAAPSQGVATGVEVVARRAGRRPAAAHAGAQVGAPPSKEGRAAATAAMAGVDCRVVAETPSCPTSSLQHGRGRHQLRDHLLRQQRPQLAHNVAPMTTRQVASPHPSRRRRRRGQKWRRRRPRAAAPRSRRSTCWTRSSCSMVSLRAGLAQNSPARRQNVAGTSTTVVCAAA